ncbi:hypothetical protein CQA66_03820 [Helicobacter aurati]|uniref:AsmA-like C-terminal region domain-containing protein n=1 Tax=Helicobacter aurati TaxID=137778 RepID=A0A3D8J634_9HELI|nr:AsmA-like C-terminal domain-containing protein [Helicobacter aurati]RDU72730.1 hypothetical protein CQA66_03820 [Helicobacter aurati]
MPSNKTNTDPQTILQIPASENGEKLSFNHTNALAAPCQKTEQLTLAEQNRKAHQSLYLVLTNNGQQQPSSSKAPDLDSKYKESESAEDSNITLALLQHITPLITMQHNTKQQMHKATMNKKLISSLSTSVFLFNNTQKETKSQHSNTGGLPKIFTSEPPSKRKRRPAVRTLTFMLLVSILLIAGYKILREGISISHIALGPIKMQNVFFQLNEKLTLRADNVDISNFNSTATTSTSNTAEILQKTTTYIQRTLYVLSYFETLELKNIMLANNEHISIYYNNANYKLDTPLFNANLSITNNQNNIHLKINTFTFKNHPAAMNGNIIYVIPKKELLFNCGIVIQSQEIVKASGITDFQKINLSASSAILKNLQSIKPYIDDLENPSLRETLQNWLYKKVKYDSIELTQFDTTIHINDIAQSLLHNTKAKMRINNAAVTLNPEVTPIYSPEVLLEFADANLKITPLNATFANMNLHGSEVLIANMPNANIYISLNGTNVRLDSHLNKLLESYGISLPVTQQSLAKNQKQNIYMQQEKEVFNSATIQQTIHDTENTVTTAINTHTAYSQESSDKTQQDSKKSRVTDSKHNNTSSLTAKTSSLYDRILELNPDTTITNESLRTFYAKNNKTTNLHLKISIEHNKKRVTEYLFSVQGLIQAQSTNISVFKIPLNAHQLNVVLDITPKQSFIYINGTKVQWKDIVTADINVLLDLQQKTLRANTYIYESRLHTNNIYVFNNEQTNNNREQLNDKQTLLHKTNVMQHDGIYLDKYANNSLQNKNIQNALKNYGYTISRVNAPLSQHDKQSSTIHDSMPIDKSEIELHNSALPPSNTPPHLSIKEQENIANISKEENKAKNDENVLKELKNNPVWDELKIRTKKTRPFKKLSTKELESLALQQIQNEQQGLSLEHDFLRIKDTSLNLSLSFANDIISLNIPALSLYLSQSNGNLTIKIENIEKILKFSPLARYYGLAHGNFNMQIPYNNKTTQTNLRNNDNTINKKELIHTTQTHVQTETKSTHIILNSANSSPHKTTNQHINSGLLQAEFVLNLTQLEHPLYTISHQRVTFLTLKGKIKDGALTITANSNLDFKSQDSLSMLRIKGYRIDLDEAYSSKIPFLVELFKDKKKEDLPYSEAAIRQEMQLIAIKNKLRKKMKINPIDFNILGENLQFTFLGYTMPFDFVTARFIDERIIIDGQYGKGIFNANIIKDNVSLHAKNFSGDFLNTVLTSTRDGKKILEDGIFSLDLLYRDGILNGSTEFQNTSLTNFKAMQNIFSLIDTVPSLFIFKNPHITTKGYQINYGKILFAMNNDYIGLQNIFLLGPSMDVNGWGIIDKDSQEMNMNLTISTIKNLSKFINKIPIIGYLILGREGQISTNLILLGKYSDPKVHITLAADIIKAPFNILRRIFTPVDLLTDTIGDEEIY